MTTHAKRTILAATLSLTLATWAMTADARSMTGFGSFKVKGAYPTNPYACLVENNGAVVNNCPFSVTLYFDLPIDNTGIHWMMVQSYWGSTASFSCDPYGVAGTGEGTTGTSGTFFGTNSIPDGYHWYATNTISPSVGTLNGGESLYMICWNVPTGAGIANINWSQ